MPKPICSDDGPESIANGFRSWLRRVGVSTRSIELGSPWENGSAASVPGRSREECLVKEGDDGLQ